jgi:hypothetical protein
LGFAAGLWSRSRGAELQNAASAAFNKSDLKFYFKKIMVAEEALVNC